MKPILIRLLRARALQPLWERLARLAHVGMNHYGGADHRQSGEEQVLHTIAERALPEFGWHVLDAGGHYGNYTAMALRALGDRATIDVFEPSTASREILMRTLADPIARGRVRCLPHALGAMAGQVRLYVPDRATSYASLHPFDPLTRGTTGAGHEETVDMTTIDAHCHDHGIDRLLLLKIDVEGHELEVLKGASTMLHRRAIQFIQFEFGEAHIDSRTFFKDFHALLHTNYDLYRVLPNGLWPVPRYSPDLEVFRVTNYLAVCKPDTAIGNVPT